MFFWVGRKQKIDSLIIRWPDGHKERKKITDTNQSVTISKGDYNFENELDIKLKNQLNFRLVIFLLNMRKLSIMIIKKKG